jgi:hypothetical protein
MLWIANGYLLLLGIFLELVHRAVDEPTKKTLPPKREGPRSCPLERANVTSESTMRRGNSRVEPR